MARTAKVGSLACNSTKNNAKVIAEQIKTMAKTYLNNSPFVYWFFFITILLFFLCNSDLVNGLQLLFESL